MTRAGDRLPPATVPAQPQPQQVILQPVFTGFASGLSYPYVRESEVRPIVIEEPARAQPTQQIFINVPGGYQGHYGYRERQVRRPYAPPVIHIIGEPSRRHMRGPIQLTHGVKPGRRLRTEPQVVWLKEESFAKGSRIKVLKRAE